MFHCWLVSRALGSTEFCRRNFWLFRKTIFPRNSVPFRSELRNGLFRGIRNSVGMSTFFRGITESIPRLFRGIFSERNSVANPSTNQPQRSETLFLTLKYQRQTLSSSNTLGKSSLFTVAPHFFFPFFYVNKEYRQR